MPQDSAIESVTIEYNDDGTLTIRARPKSSNDEGFMDSKTMTAKTVDEAVKKVKELFAVKAKPSQKKADKENPISEFFNASRMPTDAE